MIIIEGIVYVFWSIIGFILWIPMVARTIFSFSLIMIYETVANAPIETENNQKIIKIICFFYVDGFKEINKRFRRLDYIDEVSTTNNISFTSFIGETIWATVFWGTILIPFIK